MEPSTISDDKQPQRIVIINRKGHTNIAGNEHIVEELRKFYLDERKAGRGDQWQIFRDFRKSKEFEGIWFNPYRNVVEGFFRRWEQSLPFHVKKIVRNKDTQKMPEKRVLMKEVAYHELESSSKNLQQILVDDALDLIDESKKDYEAIDANGGIWGRTDYEKIRLAKKKLALAISEKVLAGAHKYQLIALKKNSEKRATAGFLMDLVRRSAAGDISEQEMEVLENSVGV